MKIPATIQIIKWRSLPFVKPFQFLGSLKTAKVSIVDLATWFRIAVCVFGSIPIQKLNAQWNPSTVDICPTQINIKTEKNYYILKRTEKDLIDVTKKKLFFKLQGRCATHLLTLKHPYDKPENPPLWDVFWELITSITIGTTCIGWCHHPAISSSKIHEVAPFHSQAAKDAGGWSSVDWTINSYCVTCYA
jgi:hypothetical protein